MTVFSTNRLVLGLNLFYFFYLSYNYIYVYIFIYSKYATRNFPFESLLNTDKEKNSLKMYFLK